MKLTWKSDSKIIHISPIQIQSAVSNMRLRMKTVKMKKLQITESLIMVKSWHDKALEIVILL